MNYCGKFKEILENENNHWFQREAEKDERFVIYCIIDNHILFYGSNKEDISPDCVYEYDSSDYKILDIYTGEIFKMELKVVFVLEN